MWRPRMQMGKQERCFGIRESIDIIDHQKGPGITALPLWKRWAGRQLHALIVDVVDESIGGGETLSTTKHRSGVVISPPVSIGPAQGCLADTSHSNKKGRRSSRAVQHLVEQGQFPITTGKDSAERLGRVTFHVERRSWAEICHLSLRSEHHGAANIAAKPSTCMT